MIDPVTPADLRTAPALAGLSDRALEDLAHHSIQIHVRAGTFLIRQGETAFKFFVVLDGRATVSTGDGPLARIGPGEVVGEMALVRGQPRTADVVADTGLRLAALMTWDYVDLVAAHPEIEAALARVAAERGG